LKSCQLQHERRPLSIGWDFRRQRVPQDGRDLSRFLTRLGPFSQQGMQFGVMKS